MSAASFPTWPHIIFRVLEPISLLCGWAAPFFDLTGFIVGQTPKTAAPLSLHSSSVALAYQLSNLYLLMFMVGVGVLYSTSEPKVVRNYLVACAIADVGHVYVTYLAMGWDAFVDVQAWNALTWGNIGATAFLLVNRIAYFMGVFGYVKAEAPKKGAKTA